MRCRGSARSRPSARAARRARPARATHRAREAIRSTGPPGSASSPVAIGAQGKKAMPSSSQRSSTSCGMAVGEVEAVLDRDHLDDLASSLELLHGDIGDADVADLALVLELLERRDRALVGHLRVGAVLLVELDRVEPQPPERALAGLPQVLGAAVARPLVRAGPSQPSLGGDQQVLRVRVERLGDQLLADMRAVGVGGVDQVDAELDRPPQDRDGLVVIGRRPPDAGAGDPHGAEAQPAHPAIADLDRAGVFVSDSRHAAASKASFSSWSARSLSPRLTCRIDQEPKPSSARTHLLAQRPQVGLLHLPVAAHLLDDQHRVRDQLGLVGPQLLGELDAEQQRSVLGHVVGRVADRLGALRQLLAGRIGDDGGDRRGPRISPGAPVDVDDDLQTYARTSSSERASEITFWARCDGISSCRANSIV